MNTIGERIRALRQARRLSQAQVARAAGITPQAVSDIETGKTQNPAPGFLCLSLQSNLHKLKHTCIILLPRCPPVSPFRRAAGDSFGGYSPAVRRRGFLGNRRQETGDERIRDRT